LEMRLDAHKKSKKAILYFKMHFKMHPPFKVLMDADFFIATVTHKVQVKEELTKMMKEKARPVTTKCVLAELRNRPEASGAALSAKRTEKIECGHAYSQEVSSAECIYAIAEENLTHKYWLAVENQKLRKSLRKFKGIPLFHFSQTRLVIESPSNINKIPTKILPEKKTKNCKTQRRSPSRSKTRA